MFGIGIPELVLIAIVALIVVGPKDLPVTLRAIGRAIREFQKASRELRKEAGFDEVVDEVTRPLREGLAGIEADVLRETEDTRYEYPEDGPDIYDALPEHANVYPDLEAEAAQPVAPEAPTRSVPAGTISRKAGVDIESASAEAPADGALGPSGGVHKAPPGFKLRPPDESDPIVAAKLRAAREGTAVSLDAIVAAKLAAVGATSSDDPIIAAKFAAGALGSRGAPGHASPGEDPIVAAKMRAQGDREAAIAAKLAALAPPQPAQTPTPEVTAEPAAPEVTAERAESPTPTDDAAQASVKPAEEQA